MFIDRGAKTPPASFEGAEWFWMVKLYLSSAPSNGVGDGSLAPLYKHRTPNGVRNEFELRLNAFVTQYFKHRFN
jgi:hypothetical protein